MNWDLEILMRVEFDVLVKYSNEYDDSFIENPIFSEIKSILKITFHTNEWIANCYKILERKRNLIDIKGLQRIQLNYSNCEKNYLLTDNYFSPFEQLDFINIGFKVNNEHKKRIRKLTRMLFDECNYHLLYEEGTNPVFKKYPIDKKSLKSRIKQPSNKNIIGKEISIIKGNKN